MHQLTSLDNRKSFETLLSNYKTCLCQLYKIKSKAKKVNASEKVVTQRLEKLTLSTMEMQENAKLCQTLNKLKFEVDSVLQKCLQDEKQTRTAVQQYINHTINQLNSRPFITSDKLEELTKETKVHDQQILTHLITCLFDTLVELNDDDEETDIVKEKQEQEEEEQTLYKKDQEIEEQEEQEEKQEEKEEALHTWILQLSTIYIKLSTTLRKHEFILEQLKQTRNIIRWGLSLIQLNFNSVTDLSCAHDYTHALSILLQFKRNDTQQQQQQMNKKNKRRKNLWTEDDYLCTLDQLDINTTFDNIINNNNNRQSSLEFAISLQDTLLKAVEAFPVYYNTLSKRLLQTIIHNMHVMMHDHVTTSNKSAVLLVNKLVDKLLDIEKIPNGWFFLSNLPFKDLSMDTTWNILCKILSITSSLSNNQPINDHHQQLPDISTFIEILRKHSTQGYFMLNCLSHIATSTNTNDTINNDYDPLSTYQSSTISHNMIVMISYTLFYIAFLDDDLKHVYYKDARESLGSICNLHGFIISFLFQWTIQSFTKMGKMTLYLFHSLPLYRWEITKRDIGLLKRVFENYSQPFHIQFVKYIVENLDLGYAVTTNKQDEDDSNDGKPSNQPWNNRNHLFLKTEIHQELCFFLLFACHCVQPKLDNMNNEQKSNIEMTLTTTSTTRQQQQQQGDDADDDSMKNIYIPSLKQLLSLSTDYIYSTKQQKIIATDIIQWSWKVVLKLKLYDCPISTRVPDITTVFLKQLLSKQQNDSIYYHGSLIVYISFMLSPTSRHFLRFESEDGWLKLMTILKKGKPEAVIEILCEIIPSFVYMHGDDFFNDENLVDFIRQIVLFKPDPLLKKTTEQIIKNKNNNNNNDNNVKVSTTTTTTTIGQHNCYFYFYLDNSDSGNSIIGSGLGLVVGSHLWQARYIDTISDLNNPGFSYFDLVLHCWLRTIFRQQHDWMMEEASLSLVDCLCKTGFLFGRNNMVHQMLTEESQRRLQYKKQMKRSNSSPKITRLFKNMFSDIDDYNTSLLVMLEKKTISSHYYYKQGTTSDKNHYVWFTFIVLLLETVQETPLRNEVSQLVKRYVENPKTPSFLDYFDITSTYNNHDNNNNRKPIESFLIYRWLRHIFNIPVGHTLTPLFLQVFFSLYFSSVSITEEKEIIYGHTFFSQKLELKLHLRNYLLDCQKYHSNDDYVEEHTETTSQNSNNSCYYTTETKEDMVVASNSLYQIYGTMLNWLENPAILDSNFDIRSLPSHYLVDRLEQCFKLKLEQEPWNNINSLWMDLINTDLLENRFMDYPWFGSDQFRDLIGIKEDQETIASLKLQQQQQQQRQKPFPSNVLPLPSLSL